MHDRAPLASILGTFDELTDLPSHCRMTKHKPTRPLSDALYMRPGFLLRRAHQLSVGIFSEEAGHVDVTPLQYGVLLVLSRADGLDQSGVSRALGFDRVTTLRVVRGLQERGLVERVPAPNDGRSFRLSLTPQGQRLLADATEPAEIASRRMLEPLSQAESRQLIRLLDKLCTALAPVGRIPLVPPSE